MDELWKQLPAIAAILVIVGRFEAHLRYMHDRMDKKDAAHTGLVEALMQKYGSVVRMVVTPKENG